MTAFVENCKHEVHAAFFTAALVVILIVKGASLGLPGLLVKLSLLMVSNFAVAPQAHPNLTGIGPVVLYLSNDSWETRYQERSPLDRCEMRTDLKRILEQAGQTPRTLTIDFDLSPAIGDDPGCQIPLDNLLDEHAKKLVLMSPLRVGSDALLHKKVAWMLARCRSGAVFGDNTLRPALGAVIDFQPNSDSMAKAVSARAASRICDDIKTTEGLEKWLRRPGLKESVAAEDEDEAEAEPINFSQFMNDVAALSLEDPAVGQIAHWPLRDVYFGGNYGGDADRFITPIGDHPGIIVHAATAWSFLYQVHETPHIIAFWLDIVIAFLFGAVIRCFWRYYSIYRRKKRGSEREISTLIVIGFIISYAVLVILSFALAVVLFWGGILIAPLVIAATMLVDGFIKGPVDEMTETHDVQDNVHPDLALATLLGFFIVTPLAFLLPEKHPQIALALGAIITVAAMISSKIFSRIYRAWPHDAGMPLKNRMWQLLILAVSGALAIGVSAMLGNPIGDSQAASLGASAAVILLLAAGMAGPQAWQAWILPPRTPAGNTLPQLLHSAFPFQNKTGGVVFVVRQLAFWGVIVYALFLMMRHHH